MDDETGTPAGENVTPAGEGVPPTDEAGTPQDAIDTPQDAGDDASGPPWTEHRGLWVLAWALSLGLCLRTVADKVVGLLARDPQDRFRASEDLSVYQDAAIALTHHLPLYEVGDHWRMGGELILTYPPFAALLFLPMAYTSTSAVVVLWHLTCLAALFTALWTVARHEGFRRPAWLAAALTGPATLLYPVASTLHYGQINLVLLALVVADLLGVIPARFRGVGIGVAASLKLTPIGYCLVLLVRRDCASIARALGTVAGIAAACWLLMPDASRRYWTDFAWDTGHSGARWYTQNQSLTGPLLRAGVGEDSVTVPYVLLALVVIAAVAFCTWTLHRRGMETAAVAVTGLGVVLAAPMSFQHHWVVVVLLPVMALVPAYRSWLPWIGGLVALFVADPAEWFMQRDWSIRLGQPWYLQLLGSLVFVVAVATLVAVTVWCVRAARGAPVTVGSRSARPDDASTH